MDAQVDVASLTLAEHVALRKEVYRYRPEIIFPWWRPCPVSVLLVTDGGLDFGIGDFGLSAFVNLLKNDGRSYVRFDITLAHLRSDVTDPQVMKGAAGIVASIKDFRFDNPTHFTSTKYDEVWLFGIETYFGSSRYAYRSTHPATHPTDRLGDEELRQLNAHMARGGGVFATGDHGALGRALCGSVNRVRSMRYWASTFIGGQDEVGMTNARRNDTNVQGDAGSQFSDQSDDIPQTLDLKLYASPWTVFRRERYPHPLLCAPSGRITVLPDHPHEGECVVPTNLANTFAPDGSDEYPAALGGGPRIAPEVIATSRVPSGNTAALFGSGKQPTIAHTFGAISAYDGRGAGVGRVVCDATWHHFINVNLIGLVEGGGFDDLTPANSWTKHDGFLSTVAGQAALAKIKDYFVNIGVWIAPAERNTCFNNRLLWDVIFRDRIMEAALVDPDVPMKKIPIDIYYHIGTAARDVIGRMAGQCRSLEWVFDFFLKPFPELVALANPWPPIPLPDPPPDPPFTLFEPMQLLDAALGAAIVSLRQAVPYPPEKFDRKVDALADRAFQEGRDFGMQLALQTMSADLGQVGGLVTASDRRLKAISKRAKASKD